VAVCRAVREAVGDDMVLMLDPWGVYTLEEAIWVGLRLEELCGDPPDLLHVE